MSEGIITFAKRSSWPFSVRTQWGIAGKFHTTTVRVERSIRHAIDITWSRGDITVLEDIFGYTVDSEKGRPSNSEFIAMVADRVRLEFRKELTKSTGPEEKANS